MGCVLRSVEELSVENSFEAPSPGLVAALHPPISDDYVRKLIAVFHGHRDPLTWKSR